MEERNAFQNTERIRVIIVDDHPMMREGTHALLRQSDDIEVVAVVGDGAAALAAVREHRPEVLILDVRLPDISGVQVAGQVRAEWPSVAVLILTGYDDPGYFQALLKIGVQGYLRKSASGEEIVAAVRAVKSGRKSFVTEGAQLPAPDGKEPFTPREIEVLELLMAGHRNSEIGEELVMSVKTVEFHVSRLLEKLGARSRSEAIHRAMVLHRQGTSNQPNQGSRPENVSSPPG